MRNLHEYLKNLILIYEVVENPILQRFLEIDEKYDPYFEYLPIDFQKNEGGILHSGLIRRRSEDNFNNSIPSKFNTKQGSKRNMNNRSNSMNKQRPSSLLATVPIEKAEANSIDKGIEREIEREIEGNKKEQNTEVPFEPSEFENNKLTNIDLPKNKITDASLISPNVGSVFDQQTFNNEEDVSPMNIDEKKEVEELMKRLDNSGK